MSFYFVLSIAIIMTFYIWRKEKSNLSLFALRFYPVAVVYAILEDFTKDRWRLTGAGLFIRNTVDALFWTVAFILSIIVTIRFLTRK